MTWLANNIGTIVVAIILIVAVLLIVRKLISDKKKGKSSCGCGCSNCSMSGECHKKL